jgi:hypothetical protein
MREQSRRRELIGGRQTKPVGKRCGAEGCTHLAIIERADKVAGLQRLGPQRTAGRLDIDAHRFSSGAELRQMLPRATDDQFDHFALLADLRQSTIPANFGRRLANIFYDGEGGSDEFRSARAPLWVRLINSSASIFHSPLVSL